MTRGVARVALHRGDGSSAVVEDLRDGSVAVVLDVGRDGSAGVASRRCDTTGAVARIAETDGRRCAWCEGPIPARARRDALTCSTPCRQARHRFVRAVGRGVASGRPLRLAAYADPPYPGNSARYYGGHPDYAGEVDHAELVSRLATYDGWALSTSVDALPAVLALCPPGVRVGAWHRGERPTRSARPLNAWEPVIYCGGRAVVSDLPGRRVDSLVHVARARTTDPRRVVGAKPAAFARWVFDLLGAAPGDEFDDLFPGSGGITRAWAEFAGVAAALRDGSAAAVAPDLETAGTA